jgi:ATP-dependent helicase HrpB
MTRLPIEDVLPEVREALATHGRLVLQAPPGAGKTTLVPLALLESAWLAEQSIVMLEPRRLATRAAAHRMAALRGERVGETVGYRIRGDTRVGRSTRVEVVTEGVLTRRLQHDPTLQGVGIVIFDEFHERSVDSDLGLALTLRTRDLVRDDLRILIMSATLDGAAVAALLGDAPIVASAGRLYPIETRYAPARADMRIEGHVSAMVSEAIRHDTGDVLVFLPGAREIHRVADALAGRNLGDAVVRPLFGAMSQDAQDEAIRRDPAGRRKIVLATSIAETSLTIEGVRVVIDAGLSRVPRFSPRTGMTRLETVRVSRASADQRRGRAGRVAPGVCYRLWPEHENSHLLASWPPEIANADLAPLALDLASAGVRDPAELRWLDPPAPAAFAQARELLRELTALDENRQITAHGLEMARLPVHPRLAHMLRRAGDDRVSLACDIAALVSERDVLRSSGGLPDADLALRVDALYGRAASSEIDRALVSRVRQEADRLRRQLGVDARSSMTSHEAIGPLLALAYPDRVAQRRPGTRARFLLRNGTGAELPEGVSLTNSEYLAIAEIDDTRPESRIFIAAAIALEDVRETFGDQIVTEDVVEFDARSETVIARRRERLGAIVLRDVSLHDPDSALVRGALEAEIRRRGLAALPWPDAATRLRERLAFVARHGEGWPPVGDADLESSLHEWLSPALDGVTRWSDLERVDLATAVGSLLDWRQRKALDALAPSHIELPNGHRAAIDYSDPEAPAVAVRIQAAFGMRESPRILDGRVPLTMRLLSPANRPVQVTKDLAGFWRSSYRDVRKDMRGRYPKHDWPEDPTAAK